MRVRPVSAAVLLICAAVGAAAAGCGDASADGGASGSGASTTVGTPSSPGAPLSQAIIRSPGSTTSSRHGTTAPSPAGTRQTAITVVAPPGGSGTAPPVATGHGASSEPVVTTTVTVTPTSKSTPTKPSKTQPSKTQPSKKAPATTSTRTRSTPTSSTHTSAPTTRSTRDAPTTHPHTGHGSLAGKVVVIDPGHNGANAAHPEIIHQQVPAGFGAHKNCNTTGTETNAGYPEYRFNWKVALALRDALQAKGITVIMTRHSDDGIGPCVNKRAAIGNNAHADAVVSIHGDGESAGIKGFYVMTAERAPAGAAMAAQSLALAKDIRDGLLGANFPASNALGQDGLWTRSDLAGLNLSQRPTVMIECGNMRNATEAALMSSADGQQRYASGIAAGVVAYLGG